MKKTICHLISCFIPIKKYRKHFRQWMKVKLINFKKIQQNYSKNLNLLKNKDKIKVAFLNWENCKWSYDTLYQKFKQSQKFIPCVVIVDKKHPSCNREKNLKFFKDKKYDTLVIKSAKELENQFDLIFYEQPWFSLDNEFSPENLSKKALCFYVPYGIELDIHNNIMRFVKKFYMSLFKTFIFNEQVKEDMRKIGLKNVVVTGHPRLDNYLLPVRHKDLWKTNKFRIIYAPHHSFSTSELKWATYEWNGDFLLKLAQKYSDTTEWIFKPHPRFYTALTEEFGKKYADKVFSDWSKVSRLYDTGDYFDLFRTSDLMISDCGSFKIEYLPSGKPFLNLVSNYPNTDPHGINYQYFMSSYYHAHDNKELEKYFDLLVNKKQDPLKEKRNQLIREFPIGSADQIYTYINDLLKSSEIE